MSDFEIPPKKKRKGNPNFVKGMAPLNPKGRPLGSSSVKTQIQTAFLEMMKTKVPVPQANGTVKNEVFFHAFNETFIRDALRPGSNAFKFLAERLYGQDILEDIDAQVNRSIREDTDFAQYRVYKRGFDIQQRVVLSQSKDIGIMAGRRAGKSETNKLKALTQCAAKMNARVLIIGLTIMKTVQIYSDDIRKICEEIGFDHTPDVTENNIKFSNGSLLQFGGNSSKVEREKYRGQHWDLIIIDEAQSQPSLGSFLKEIINPMLLDTNGTLMLTGSGPRTRGTDWEKFFMHQSPSGLRINWNLSSNPFIYDYQKALENERAKHGLTENDPLYLREYLGLICYDDDALVYRMADENYFTDEDMLAWLKTQSPEDIRFVGGLDFGFRDSDAFVVIMYSEKSNEKWIVYEYKKSGTDVTELCEAIRDAKNYIKTSTLFVDCYHKDFDIFADTSDQKISMELSHRYGIPVYNAVKYDKAMAVQMLQEETRKRNLKIKKGSQFDEEALRTIFKRIEQEGQPSIITREIDDEVYHPDLMDAILYSLRNYWLTHSQDHKVEKPIGMPTEQEQNQQFMEDSFNITNRSREQLF